MGMGWPLKASWLGGPEPAPFQHGSSRYLGASRRAQAEPGTVPLGKAQPALAWRQVPAAGSELGCQLSSSVLQDMRCLGTCGLPLGWQQPRRSGAPRSAAPGLLNVLPLAGAGTSVSLTEIQVFSHCCWCWLRGS